MDHSYKNNLHKRRFFEMLFLFLALFVNEDVLVFGTIQNIGLQRFRLVVQTLLPICMLLYVAVKRIPVKKSKVETWLLFSLMILATMLGNRDFRNGYVVLILTYLECMLLTSIFSFEEIYEFFSGAMYVLCSASLIGFGLQLFAPNVLKLFPEIQNVAGTRFYFLGVTNVAVKTDNFIRNWGPYREPGVFQVFIIIALIYTLFKKENCDFRTVVVYVIALLTTFSTTGYIAFAFVIFALVVMKKQNLSKQRRKLIHTLLSFCMLAFVYMALFTDLLFKDGYGSVFGKIAAGQGSASFRARAASFSVNIAMFLKNPLFGKGITYVDSMFTPLALERYRFLIKDNTNMLFIHMAKFGFPFFFYFVVRYTRSMKASYDYGILVWGALLAAYFIFMVGENLSYSILMNLPLFTIASDLATTGNTEKTGCVCV